MSAQSRTVKLGSDSGLAVELLNYGATLSRIRVPTSAGEIDVILRYPSADQYPTDTNCMGSTVGRFANRLRQAGVDVAADGADASGILLHSGSKGFHRRYWEYDAEAGQCADTATFRLTTGDREDGFPGRMEAIVRYAILGGDTLDIELRAQTDAPSPVNLTNHAYFNLSSTATSIDQHELIVHADEFTELDDKLLPTGTIRDVAGSVFDFRRARQLSGADAVIDQNMVIRGAPGRLRPAAELVSSDTGLRLSVATTQPGLQVYTGDNLTGPFAPRAGVCLEAQNFPDAPNHANFPAAYVGPGRSYAERIRYRFAAA